MGDFLLLLFFFCLCIPTCSFIYCIACNKYIAIVFNKYIAFVGGKNVHGLCDNFSSFEDFFSFTLVSHVCSISNATRF